MKLIGVFANNYKAYKSLELEIKPFNIIIGKNSAGKSALLRLIPFITESIKSSSSSPLNFSPLDLEIAGDYNDLVHGHKDVTPLTLGAHFKKDSIVYSIKCDLIYSTELESVIIKSFTLLEFTDIIYQLDLDIDKLEKKGIATYCNAGKSTKATFQGLLPNSKLRSKISRLINEIRSFSYNVSYIGPFRESSSRNYAKRNLGCLDIGLDGKNAPYVFYEQNKISKGEIEKNIKSWMQCRFFNKFFKIKYYEKTFSVMCSTGMSETNIVDEGMGFSQIFPSIINRFVRDENKIQGIEIIEQPELHMHPAACGNIADLYLEAIKNKNVIFIETHSKEIVLRVRRRVAEKKEIKENINIIYIDNEANTSQLKFIKLQDDGLLDWWPAGIFEEDFDEVVALNKAVDDASKN